MSIAPGVIVENIGDDVVVMVPGSTEVIKLSGEVAHTIRSIQAGETSVLPSETVSELVDRGIVVSQAGMSRRGLIKAGAIGAGAGIAVMAMPGAAAASSGSCFTPASFNVGVGLNSDGGDWEYITINFDRPNIPTGLVATIPNNHPGTFTYTGGEPIPVLWETASERFAAFLTPNIPLAQENALRVGSVSFTLNGCSYTGTGNLLEA
jgi:hypothetical protein